MKSNDDENLDRLLRAARGFETDTSNLENHFETRLMARIRESHSVQTEWLSWTWRFAGFFSLLAAFLVMYTFAMDVSRPQNLFTLLANNQEHQIIVSYLVGD